MPIDLATVPGLVDAARAGNMVPFIGAGISCQAKTADKRNFPTWEKLIKEMAGRACSQGMLPVEEKEEIERLVDRGRHLMAAQHLKDTAVFEEVIKERFDPEDAEPGLIHGELFDLKASLIVTTNYDKLLEQAYCNKHQRYPTVVTFQNAKDVVFNLRGDKRKSPLIFKIHGTVDDPRNVVLAEKDYRKLIYKEPGYRTVLSAIFVTKVVLMLGFSFTDPELTVLTESLRDAFQHTSTPDYIVLPAGRKGSVEKRRLRMDFGLHVIEYDEQNREAELLDLVRQLAKEVADVRGPSPEVPIPLGSALSLP
jgi:NAD-dependent SIR2 family protein deacetylase